MGEETAPTLGYTVGCELIGADVETTGAIGADVATIGTVDATGANTVDDGAADAYTAGATEDVAPAGCAKVVAGVTTAPAGSCSPGT